MGKVPRGTGLDPEEFPQWSILSHQPTTRGEPRFPSGAAHVSDSSHTLQLSRSTYCLKGPWRQQLLPPLAPGAKESTWRLPAAVRLPRASSFRCSCARGPSCAVSSAGIRTSSTGRTRSMAPAPPGEAALPGPGLAAILARAFLPVEAPGLRHGPAQCFGPCDSHVNGEAVLRLSFS